MADRPNLLAPPPVFFAVCVIAAVIVDHFVPLPIVRDANIARYIAGVVLFAIAIAIAARARNELMRHNEHPNPYKPTNAIVDTGIYGRTRNPLYIAFQIIALGVAAFANSWWVIIAMIPMFLLLHFAVVLREEQYLSGKFGAPYDDYRRRVRRWI